MLCVGHTKGIFTVGCSSNYCRNVCTHTLEELIQRNIVTSGSLMGTLAGPCQESMMFNNVEKVFRDMAGPRDIM